ncbi:FCS-Like Zinc finger 15 [Ziziphus jujuba]|uniref:FCS-Like Zinc finger 15 n=2 Tax=Ziziphus jujuba TaxID=326968 RepID=A0A6P4ANT3_ZIZJJ|nr:FCS-Like Zinc finger 15 [Ziziphus jujuba]KAH7513387.1 hypothetical protein FEM48_Zijuj12G0194600 [Ziziphus jujuba var. spinosa]
MVGLSVVLESQKSSVSKKIPQVINKTTMMISNSKPSSSSSSTMPPLSYPQRNFSQTSSLTPTFLDQCFLCNQKLLPGKDIYMYRGDRAFCSVECRCRQIFMDEEESIRKDNCSLAAIKPSSSSSSSSSSSASRHRKGNRNRAGGFAY